MTLLNALCMREDDTEESFMLASPETRPSMRNSMAMVIGCFIALSILAGIVRFSFSFIGGTSVDSSLMIIERTVRKNAPMISREAAPTAVPSKFTA